MNQSEGAWWKRGVSYRAVLREIEVPREVLVVSVQICFNKETFGPLDEIPVRAIMLGHHYFSGESLLILKA